MCWRHTLASVVREKSAEPKEKKNFLPGVQKPLVYKKCLRECVIAELYVENQKAHIM